MAEALNTLKFSDSVLNVRSSYTASGSTYNHPCISIDSVIVADEGCGQMTLFTNGNSTSLTLLDGSHSEALSLSTDYAGRNYNGSIAFDYGEYVLAASSGNLVIDDGCGNTGVMFSNNGGWGMYLFDGAAPTFFGLHCGYTEIWDPDNQYPVFRAASGAVDSIFLSSIDSLQFMGGGKIEIDQNGFLKAACGLQ